MEKVYLPGTQILSLLQRTFGEYFPDLRGRTAVHGGNGRAVGDTVTRTQRITLTLDQLPAHSHAVNLDALTEVHGTMID